jgi:hypothetical protein
VEQFHALHRLPLWNPLVYGGVPTIEAGTGDILYPAGWLHFVLPLIPALAWKLILHVFLAGLFTYAAARALGASRWVALLAGAAYQLGPNLVSLVWGGQDGKMYVIALFPAAVWLLVTGLRDRSWLRFVWLGVVAGLMLLAHPQLAYYAYLTLGVWAVVSLVARRSDGPAALITRLGGGVTALVMALGVSAIVLLPMYRYLRTDSPRAGPGKGYEYAASYSLHAEEMVNLVVPDFSGVADTYWGRNPLKHNIEYPGVIVLGLALAGLLGLRGDPRRWGLGTMAVLVLLYGLGAGTPVFRLFYVLVPGVRNFRAPSLSAFVAFTGLTLLGALALDRILRQHDDRLARIAVWTFAGLGGFAFLWFMVLQLRGSAGLGAWFAVFGEPRGSSALEANLPHMVLGSLLATLWCGLAALGLWLWRRNLLGGRGLIVGLLLISVVDLVRVDSPFVEIVRYDQFFPDDPGITALKQSLGPGERALAFPGLFPTSGHLATYDIPQVFGYHGNQLRWYDELTRRDAREGGQGQLAAQQYWMQLLASPVLRVLAARVVIVPFRVDLPGYVSLGGNQHLAIYRNTRALTGATIVPAVQVQPDSAKQIAELWNPDFDPTQTALVFGPVPALAAGGGKGQATIVGNAADTVAVQATTDGPAMLLLSRNWHPSWQASVDGAPAPVVRLDYALLGVPLAGPGTHQVTLRYAPSIVAVARRISIVAWLIALGLALAGGVRGWLQRRASA